MRAATRLLASVKPARFLEAGNPTGLTGLFTHPAPRSTLLFLYESTLDRLQSFPEHSVYRQSTEAITKHRHAVVTSVKAAGYDEWSQRISEIIEKHPGVFSGEYDSPYRVGRVGNSVFVAAEQKLEDERLVEWDGEKVTRGTLEGPRTAEERLNHKYRRPSKPAMDLDALKWEPEPPLEASQIMEIENRIGGGLIEEVIQVAEGELKLVETMLESKVWEELEEKAPPGQWEYFARDQHTPGTQEPASK